MRWTVLIFASAMACTGPSSEARPPQQRGTPGPPASSAPPEWSSCTADADCVDVGRVCCACGGEGVVHVHRAFEAQARARFAPEGCPDCPPVRCLETTPVCRGGACVEGSPAPPSPPR